MIESSLYHRMQELLPISCVDVLIEFEGQILLLKRNNHPAKGQFWFPGGRLFKMESIVDAALRKAKEETNLTCTFVKQISTEETIFPQVGEMAFPVHTINVCCLLTVADIENLEVDHYHADYIWIDSIDSNWHCGVQNPLKQIGYKQID